LKYTYYGNVNQTSKSLARTVYIREVRAKNVKAGFKVASAIIWCSGMRYITIERGPSGRKLKQPFTLEIPDDESEPARKLCQYIIDALIVEYPKLLRFTFENSSIKALAEHLLRHRTGSLNTLRSYVYHIYLFSKWLQKEPDQFLNECKGRNRVPIPKAVIQMRHLLVDFLDNLQEENGLAPVTV